LLIIGNSLTYYNGGINNAVAQNLDAGIPSFTSVEGAAVAFAAAKFIQHLEALGSPGSDLYQKIIGTPNTWDWIALQEQSQIPSFFDIGGDDAAQSLAAAKGMADIFRQYQPNAKIVWMETWGFINGDPDNPSFNPDYLTMQANLERGYKLYSTTTSIPGRITYVAPCGKAFKMVYFDEKAGNAAYAFGSLYSDNKHPSGGGTTLAGYVIYATITGRDPRQLPGSDSYLSSVAYRTVLLQETFADNLAMPFEINIQDYAPYRSSPANWNGIITGTELVAAVRYSSRQDPLNRGSNAPLSNPFRVNNLVLGSQTSGPPRTSGGRFFVSNGKVIVRDTVKVGGPNGAYGELLLGQNGVLITRDLVLGSSPSSSGVILLRGAGSRLRVENRAYKHTNAIAPGTIIWAGTLEAASWEMHLSHGAGVYRPITGRAGTKTVKGRYTQAAATAQLDLTVSNNGQDFLQVSSTMSLKGSVFVNVGRLGLAVGRSMTVARASTIQTYSTTRLVAPPGFTLAIQKINGKMELILTNARGSASGMLSAPGRPA
jgi:hypothetical protein